MTIKDFTATSFDHKIEPSGNPNCKTATSNAYSKLKIILFKPFCFEKWLILALCVWLVNTFENYGQQGFGFIGNLKSEQFFQVKNFNLKAAASSFIGNANSFTEAKIGMSLILAITLIFIISIVITFILLWLKSRFNFIFLDNLKSNTQRISGPWKYYKHVGNSCFLWTICFQLISFLVGAVIFIVFIIFLFNILSRVQESAYAITILALAIAPFLSIFFLIYIITATLFKHFVIPVMYKMEINSIPAWKIVMSLISNNPASFIKYLLMLLLYSTISVFVVLLLVLCTCCLLGCLFSMPIAGGYISSLVLLPIFLFFRLLGVEYLAQFGEDYDLQILE